MVGSFSPASRSAGTRSIAPSARLAVPGPVGAGRLGRSTEWTTGGNVTPNEHLLTLGLVLTPVPRGRKGPIGAGWNTAERWLDTPEKEAAHQRRHPTDGRGIIHDPSETAALDVDREADAKPLLLAEGFDLEAELERGLQILSPRPGSRKLLYRLPQGCRLPLKRIMVPDSTAVAAELRAGPVHDMAPPSPHPLGPLYAWWPTVPRTREDIPMIPESLLRMWERLATPAPEPTPAPTPLPARPHQSERASVIEAFNVAYGVDYILLAHGYKQQGKRWIAPASSTGLAGVVKVARGIYSHHGSDPLATGHAHDAFSLYAHLEHGGDIRTAVKAAAELLGMPSRATTPAPTRTSRRVARPKRKAWA